VCYYKFIFKNTLKNSVGKVKEKRKGGGGGGGDPWSTRSGDQHRRESNILQCSVSCCSINRALSSRTINSLHTMLPAHHLSLDKQARASCWPQHFQERPHNIPYQAAKRVTKPVHMGTHAPICPLWCAHSTTWTCFYLYCKIFYSQYFKIMSRLKGIPQEPWQPTTNKPPHLYPRSMSGEQPSYQWTSDWMSYKPSKKAQVLHMLIFLCLWLFIVVMCLDFPLQRTDLDWVRSHMFITSNVSG